MTQIVGQISEAISNLYRGVFERRCVELLAEACSHVQAQRHPDTNWPEENITANIDDYLRNSQKMRNYDIHIDSDYYLWDSDILSNAKTAHSAPRIDMSFCNYRIAKRFVFYVEAKNLIEHPCRKFGRKSMLQPNAIQRRYIEKGIDHYVTQYYPMPGVMLGYILEGDVSLIVKGINSILVQANRLTEIMQNVMSEDGRFSKFQSIHSSLTEPLSHYWFRFS